MRVLLAPMEGLADDVLRGVLTRLGGYDWAVSEFARVSGTLLPRRFFERVSPELRNHGRTRSGTPVHVQLLGSDPSCMADNAAVLAALCPPGIDLNFGCPAPTVNRHRGGAVLLDEPELMHAIAVAVSRAVPRTLPLSAKMRLGVDDPGRALEAAQALQEGGVELLVVHARTKADGYRPPARWEWIGHLAERLDIPVIANGEIWCEADWARCREISGAADVMLGRGAVADPFLAARLKRGGGDLCSKDEEWARLLPLLGEYWQGVRAKVEARHAPGRLKQWLNLLRRRYAQAEHLYTNLRALAACSEVERVLVSHGIPAGEMPRAA